MSLITRGSFFEKVDKAVGFDVVFIGRLMCSIMPPAGIRVSGVMYWCRISHPSSLNPYFNLTDSHVTLKSLQARQIPMFVSLLLCTEAGATEALNESAVQSMTLFPINTVNYWRSGGWGDMPDDIHRREWCSAGLFREAAHFPLGKVRQLVCQNETSVNNSDRRW